MAKVKKTIGDCVAMYRAIGELQPKSQSIINSDYDMGLKAAYSFNRTSDYLDVPLEPLRKLEEKFGKEIQALASGVQDGTKEEKEEAQEKADKLQESFNKDRNDLLQLEEEVQVHTIDLADISEKTKTPAFWILDALRDCFTNKVTGTSKVKITIKEALEVVKAVRLYLAAPTPWEIQNARAQNPDAEISDDLKYPNDCGWPLASKLFWLTQVIQNELKDFMAEYDKKIEDLGKIKDKKKSLSQTEEFELWASKKLEEVVEFEGVDTITLSDFPNDLATPSGAVIGGLMPILEDA